MAKKSIFQKAASLIGLSATDMDEQDYFEDEYEDEPQYRDEAEDSYDDKSDFSYSRQRYEEPEEEPAYKDNSFAASRRSKIIPMPDNYRGSDRMRMVIFRPTSFDETQSLIDNLKARRPVVINLDEVDVRLAQRMLDFIGGSAYTLGGELKKVARNIFVVCPANIELTTNLDEEEYRENAM